MAGRRDEMDLARRAVDAALAAGAEYADTRVGRLVAEELVVKNGQIGAAEAPEELGIGVRARVNGCFGFAAAPPPGARVVRINRSTNK